MNTHAKFHRNPSTLKYFKIGGTIAVLIFYGFPLILLSEFQSAITRSPAGIS